MTIKLNLLGIHELDLTLGGTTTAAISSPGVLSVTNVPTFVSLTTTGTSGAATLSGGVLNIPQYSGGSGMVYPGAGIPNSTGSAWGTSFTTTGTGTVVALSASPAFTGTVSVATLSASGSIQSDVNYNSLSAIPYSGTGSDFVGLGWNATSGGAEMDLWNSSIGYTGGFNFYQNSGSGYTLAASISGAGVIKSAGTPVTLTIASGTASLGTSAIAAGSAATVVSVAATGVLSTDNVLGDFSADPTSTTGYIPSTSGGLTIVKYCTSGHVNFKVVNFTGVSITPGAVTLNWRVVR